MNVSSIRDVTCLGMLKRVYNLGGEKLHVEDWDHDLHKGGVLQDESCILVERILPCGRLKGGTQTRLCQQEAILLH